MKKLIIKIILFLGICTVLDFAIGKGLAYMITKAKGGDYGRNEYIVNKSNEDILLFGSSRSIHHYNPMIIEDSLKMSCFNCGRDGNGILMLYPYYKMISERYQPKLIIYDLNGFDMDQDSKDKYFKWLIPFYGRSIVDSTIYKINSDEKFKMLCKAYKYNGKMIQILSDAIHPIQKDIKGYKPLNGVMSYEPKIAISEKKDKYEPDSLKIDYLERLIIDCKRNNTKLVFVISPYYNSDNKNIKRVAEELCSKYNTPLLYYANDRRFYKKKKYFQDSVHLNSLGADNFTKILLVDIKNILR